MQAIAHLQLLRTACYEIQALTVEPNPMTIGYPRGKIDTTQRMGIFTLCLLNKTYYMAMATVYRCPKNGRTYHPKYDQFQTYLSMATWKIIYG